MKSFYGGLFSGLTEATMSFLACCVALYLGVRLIEEVLPQLLIGMGVVVGIATLIGLTILITRYRRSGW